MKARWQIYILVLLVQMIFCGSMSAQYNSDYKTVAKKKIRTVTAFKFDEYGDTLFYRFTYDQKGKLIETSYYGKNRGEYTLSYAASGKQIGFREVFISETEIGLPNPTGKTRRYDTAFVRIQKFEENTGDKTYDLSLDYNNDGFRNSGSITKVCGDTTYYYRFKDSEFTLREFTIKSKVDSIRRGYALTQYQLNFEKEEWIYETPDTSVGSSVYVLDKNGYPIRYYHVYAQEQPVEHIRKSDGTFYNPIHDSIAYLRLIYTYTNVYRKDGSLEYCIQTSPWTKESRRMTNNILNTPIQPFESLESIEKFGTTTYQYYQN